MKSLANQKRNGEGLAVNQCVCFFLFPNQPDVPYLFNTLPHVVSAAAANSGS